MDALAARTVPVGQIVVLCERTNFGSDFSTGLLRPTDLVLVLEHTPSASVVDVVRSAAGADSTGDPRNSQEKAGVPVCTAADFGSNTRRKFQYSTVAFLVTLCTRRPCTRWRRGVDAPARLRDAHAAQ